jgi:hypothetical protein
MLERRDLALPKYLWVKEFLEAGKQCLVGGTLPQANSLEVTEMRSKIDQLKQMVAELTLKNKVLKKSLQWKDNILGLKKYLFAKPDSCLVCLEDGHHRKQEFKLPILDRKVTSSRTAASK